MAIVYELFAKAGEYTNKEGEQKVRWHKCGVVIESRNGGMAANIESLPTNFDGWLQIKPPRPKENGAGGAPTNQGAGNNNYQLDDIPESEIPF